jgi:hypothetical protein
MKKAAILVMASALLLGAAPIASAVARSRTDRQDHAAEKTASQIFDEEAAQIAAIKAKLRLTPEQEKSWADLETALRDIAKKRADRLVIIRSALAQPKGPVDLVEQWRNIADILNDRSIELKTLADAAQPLYSSLSDEQKKQFKEQIQRLEANVAEGGLK